MSPVTDLLIQARTMPLSARIGIAIVLGYAFVAIFAPMIAPYGEAEIVGPKYLPWQAPHWLGTDVLGRDVLSRMIFGARNTVGIALLTTVLAFLLGASTGLMAATLGGWFDALCHL